MEQNNLIGTIITVMVIISGVTYIAISTQNELTCKTGDGWEVISTIKASDNSTIYVSQCQYKTKEWVNSYCSSFRATPIYLRYGCKEMTLTQLKTQLLRPLTPDQGATEMLYIYNEQLYHCEDKIGCKIVG